MHIKKLICLSLLSSCAMLAGAADELKPFVFPRAMPEQEGVSSAAILDFVAAADQKIDSLHSFMLVRHGHVVAEGWWSPYAAEVPHVMFSLSKSFTSTAVGMAVTEGKLSLDDEVLKFFPEDAPVNPSDNLKAMRVRDLLIMSSGQIAKEVTNFSFDAPEPLTREFLAMPVEHKPGTYFFYNTPGSYMLSAIVQKVTGKTVLDYLTPRLFEPLGIEHPVWDKSPQGICLGGYGLHIRTEDIARFGELYLHQGNWHGKQLLPAAWVATATARQTSNGSNPNSDWEQGYGYQFWRCRHGFFRGDGAFGQFCVVMPEQDAVVAITSGTKDLAGVLNLVWDKLLPGMKSQPLPENPDADKKLADKLAGLKISVAPGTGSPGNATQFFGQTYLFPTNAQKLESIALESTGAGVPLVLVLHCGGVEYRVPCGNGEWAKSKLSYSTLLDQMVAASGAWQDDGSYAAKICFYETPFVLNLKLNFAGDQLNCNAAFNVDWHGAPNDVKLIGRKQ
jgi:CubicO group peptidase (beta-lactamase class C family)